MKPYLVLLMVFTFLAPYASYARDRGDLPLPMMESSSLQAPTTINLDNRQQLDKLARQLANKRVLFVGEVHDKLEHHQNQLRVIQGLYEHYPDLAIGVEYFQQPFQQYLDDYIAGRIDEREMLKKTEYFKRWQLDYRLFRPIFSYAREKHIPVIALNVSDEIHSKVFKSGMKSLDALQLAQIPDYIQPANENYLRRLKAIYDSHPTSNEFWTFVEGVLLWDESMADSAARYLNSHPSSRMVVLAGMVHVMYGDGIPERLNRRLGSAQSIVAINGNDFGNYPGIADYQLATNGNIELPNTGKMGVSIVDSFGASGMGGVRVNAFTPNSAAQAAGFEVGDLIVALNGMKVTSIAELKSFMFDRLPGEKIQVAIQRGATQDIQQEMLFELVLR